MLKAALVETRKNVFSQPDGEESISHELIRQELKRIVASRHFRTSRRGKEFLLYVVNQTMDGNSDLLKERLIGAQIFGRKPDYATGEDPVVRVQAGDVRRRLELYHSDTEIHPEVVIRIPLGSYAPVFQWKKDQPAQEPLVPDATVPVESVGAGPLATLSGTGDHDASAADGGGLPHCCGRCVGRSA